MTPSDMLEQRDERLGVGDGVCLIYSTAVWPRPIIEGSAEVYTVPFGVLDSLIDPKDRPPLTETEARIGIHGSLGSVTVELTEPLPVAWELRVRYLWQPPRLRRCKICVQHPDGTVEWVLIEEVADAILRFG